MHVQSGERLGAQLPAAPQAVRWKPAGLHTHRHRPPPRSPPAEARQGEAHLAAAHHVCHGPAAGAAAGAGTGGASPHGGGGANRLRGGHAHAAPTHDAGAAPRSARQGGCVREHVHARADAEGARELPAQPGGWLGRRVAAASCGGFVVVRRAGPGGPSSPAKLRHAAAVLLTSPSAPGFHCSSPAPRPMRPLQAWRRPPGPWAECPRHQQAWAACPRRPPACSSRALRRRGPRAARPRRPEAPARGRQKGRRRRPPHLAPARCPRRRPAWGWAAWACRRLPRAGWGADRRRHPACGGLPLAACRRPRPQACSCDPPWAARRPPWVDPRRRPPGWAGPRPRHPRSSSRAACRRRHSSSSRRTRLRRRPRLLRREVKAPGGNQHAESQLRIALRDLASSVAFSGPVRSMLTKGYVKEGGRQTLHAVVSTRRQGAQVKGAVRRSLMKWEHIASLHG